MAQRHGCWAAALLIAAAIARGAAAQELGIEGEAITAQDIDQRSRLDEFAMHKAPLRQDVIDELRKEAATAQMAHKRGIDIPDADVDQAYANMATRLHRTVDQLTEMLAEAGIEARALKRRIRADLTWMQYLRARRSPREAPDWMDPRLWDPGPPLEGPRWCVYCRQISYGGGRATRRTAEGAEPSVEDHHLDVSDAMVDEAIAGWARRMHMTPAQLNKALVRAGYDSAALRELVRADIEARRRSKGPPPQQ